MLASSFSFMETELSISEDNYPFWKNLVLTGIFLLVTPIALLVSIISLFSIDKQKGQVASASIELPNLIQEPKSGVQVYASLPNNYPSISGDIESADARPEIIRQYLASYRSPMTNQANILVKTADKYGLDWRLTTAIAMKESGLCKAIPIGSFNCWGWGIHSEGSLGFRSFEEGIETVSKGLRVEYLDKGYETVDDIMKKYAHPDSTTWADGVNSYIDKIQ